MHLVLSWCIHKESGSPLSATPAGQRVTAIGFASQASLLLAEQAWFPLPVLTSCAPAFSTLNGLALDSSQYAFVFAGLICPNLGTEFQVLSDNNNSNTITM